jgi:Rrf2 family iron-sulfur cluster assembly transcriptional regulator
MKFTALEEYGLRCILRLARKETQDRERRSFDRAAGSSDNALAPDATGQWGETAEPEGASSVSIGEIAADEGLTQQYAGKIFRILAKAGLVESERGRKGGYRLTRAPEKISVAETLDALGGRMFDVKVCGRYTGDRHLCVHSTDCAIRSLWRGLQEMMDRVLIRTALSDLVVSEHTMNETVKGYAQLFAPVAIPAGMVDPRAEAVHPPAENKVTFDERTE